MTKLKLVFGLLLVLLIAGCYQNTSASLTQPLQQINASVGELSKKIETLDIRIKNLEGQATPAPTPKPPEPDKPGEILSDHEKECARVGGEWMGFPNGCVDSCEKARSKESVMCTQALTRGCECGSSRCWNGSTCENNEPTNFND